MILQYLNLWKGTFRSPSLVGIQEQTFTLVVVYFVPWHRLVMHFGDRSKEWVPGDPLQFAGATGEALLGCVQGG